MSCPTKLVADIINSCKTVKGIKPFAYWVYRKDVTFTITGNDITAVNVPILGTIQAHKFALNAGFEIVSAEDNGNGFKHKFSGVINASTLTLDEMDDIVVFVQTNSGQWLAYGVTQGLWKVSQAKMANENLATIAVEFASLEGREESYSEYVVTADLSALPVITDYDTISGGTIATGEDVGLTIDADKTGYIKLPDGTILTTVAGAIANTYTGVGGAITYYIPKNSAMVQLINSGLTGAIIYNGISEFSMSESSVTSLIANNTDYLDLNGSGSLANLVDGKAVTCTAVGCALTAKSIGDILYAAYIDNRENVVFDFSGGTNAPYGDSLTGIYKYVLDTYGINLDDLTSVLSNLGGTFTFNEV